MGEHNCLPTIFMKIVAISDIHSSYNLSSKLAEQEGDMLIIAGDLTQLGMEWEMKKMLDKVDKAKFKHKIVVLGNHEVYTGYSWCKQNYKNIIFLNNEIVEVEGIRIYGTPYSKRFSNWSYPYNDIEECLEKTIPKEDVDIIVSHEPPSDYNLSLSFSMVDIGNKELRKYLENTNRHMIVVSGHCHECGGNMATIGKSTCYNVASKFTTINFHRGDFV